MPRVPFAKISSKKKLLQVGAKLFFLSLIKNMMFFGNEFLMYKGRVVKHAVKARQFFYVT